MDNLKETFLIFWQVHPLFHSSSVHVFLSFYRTFNFISFPLIEFFKKKIIFIEFFLVKLTWSLKCITRRPCFLFCFGGHIQNNPLPPICVHKHYKFTKQQNIQSLQFKIVSFVKGLSNVEIFFPQERTSNQVYKTCSTISKLSQTKQDNGVATNHNHTHIQHPKLFSIIV